MDNMLKRTIRPFIVKLGRRIEKRHFTRKPVIIGACPRSGTTLLLSILDSYPGIFGIKNQTYAFCEWKDSPLSPFPYRLDRLYREFLVTKIPVQKARWCEKTPKNIRYLPQILKYFQKDAKIINLVRDGRDVITSKHPKHNPDDFWVSINRWVYDVKIGLKYSKEENVLTVRYEDLITNFTPVMKTISDFLEEDFVPDKETWVQYTSLKKSKHWAKPLHKIHAKSINRWERNEYKEVMDSFYGNPEAVALLKRLNYL